MTVTDCTIHAMMCCVDAAHRTSCATTMCRTVFVLSSDETVGSHHSEPGAGVLDQARDEKVAASKSSRGMERETRQDQIGADSTGSAQS